jgi:methylthioribose-1-phosphate isomerase
MATETGNAYDTVRAIDWRDDALQLLDQRRLPEQEHVLDLHTPVEVAAAIRDMVVRGAPAIGIAAAYGAVLSARLRYAADPQAWRVGFAHDLERLAESRPTAVNLFWALERMRGLANRLRGDPGPPLLEAARRLHEADTRANHRMGDLGAALIECDAVLTHCNTGSLATGGYGTALGVVRSAYAYGRIGRVYADETRPWLQGSRLTAWELARDGIPVELICEGAAASLMQSGAVSWVIVGADRVAANGDVANKIGTYSLAVLARHHGVRFMVVAPTSTIDPHTPNGDAIPIERRPGEEVVTLRGRRLAPQGVQAWNPVFDVTPAGLIDALVTEAGVLRGPDAAGIARLLRAASQDLGA